MARKKPKRTYIKPRDDQILRALLYTGIMSLSQIDQWFFTGNGSAWPRQRMDQLEKAGLIKRLRGELAQYAPRGERVYVLYKKGAERAAHSQGISLADVRWKAYGRKSKIRHDLRMTTIYMTAIRLAEADSSLKLYEWWPEWWFQAEADLIKFTDPVTEKRDKRRVIPDGYMVLRQHTPEGKTREYAYFLELDMSTHPNPRFGRNKVAAGAAYLRSSAYKRRFGRDYGRWLIIVKSQERMVTLLETIKRYEGDRLFNIALFDDISPETLLYAPIWRNTVSPEPFALMEPVIPEIEEKDTTSVEKGDSFSGHIYPGL